MDKNIELQALIEEFQEKMIREEKSCEIYEKFLIACGHATFEFKPVEIDGETYEACFLGEGKTVLKSEDYPDYYGGAYIDNRGILVINVVGDLTECKKKIEQIVGEVDGYIIRPSLYSYKELLQIKEHFESMSMSKLQKEVFSNVTGYGPSDKDNLFVVEMEIFDKDSIKLFKDNILNSEMIKFRKGERDSDDTTIRPGRGITRNNLTAGSSLAFRASRDTTPGFVVSGHSAEFGGGAGTPFRLNGPNTTILGRVIFWVVSGPTDAAFCNRESGIQLSNLIHQNGHVLHAATNVAPYGATVWLAGRNNLSNARRGEVVETNAVSTITDRPILFGARATYDASSGDSGGLVYRNLTTGRRIVGVHARSSATRGFYTLIAPIMRDLRLTLW